MTTGGCESSPPRVDLRQLAGPIRDQGGRPTCLSFATSSAHEFKLLSEQLAPEALYKFAQLYGDSPCDGSTVSAMAAAIEHRGQCREIDWPYGEAAATNPEADYFRASCIHGKNSLLEFTLSALAAKSSPVIAVAITDAWFQVGSDGYIDSTNSSGGLIGYHAVAAVGYDEDSHRILIRNSWGKDWGLAGYGFLPYEEFDTRVVSVFTLA